MNSLVTYSDNSSHKGNNIFQAPLTNLETAIQEIIKKWDGDERLCDIIDDLADYITNHPTRKIIGLEKKLEQGGRPDLSENATALKNKFERRVAKNQMSMTEQQVYVQVLSAINTIWQHRIRHLIENDADKKEIDGVILEELVKPIHKAIVGFDCAISTELVSGMLYFLTGKCHLVWRKEC